MRSLLLPAVTLAALLLLPCAAALAEEGQVVDDEVKRKKEAMLFRLRVKRAIGSGARWVATCQKKDGSFELPGNKAGGPFPQSRHGFGVTALCTYTLADCGYDAEHPVIEKAVRYLRKRYRSYFKGDHWPQASSYSLSLMVLALHTLYVKPETEKRANERDRYGKRKVDKKNPCGYPDWARKAIDRILDWFMKNQAETGLFRYPGGFNTGTRPPGGMPGGPPPSHYGDEDLSNTQYVLLALWAGSRCGYEITGPQLEKIANRLLSYQAKLGRRVKRVEDPAPAKDEPAKKGDGHRYAEPSPPGESEDEGPFDRARGFPYTKSAEITGSMTTAGLSSLVIVKAMMRERGTLSPAMATKLDKGIWDAIAWLQFNYSVHDNPGAGLRWQYYYLYGLERACVIAGKRFLGEHDWYRDGAALLLDAQKDDGRWAPGGQLGGFGGGVAYRTCLLDTCFALLFLKRATIKPKEPVLDNPGPVVTGDR